MAEIYFKIVDSNPEEHQILVRFFSDKLPESALVADYKSDGKTPATYRTEYAITLPHPAPKGEALREYVMRHCPTEWFDLKHAVMDPAIDTSLSGVAIGAVIKGRAPEPGLEELRLAKNSQIDDWRAYSNGATFPYGGKHIKCDALSRSDIDGVANHIALFGVFPEGFPGGWKATDKTMLPLPDVDAFREMYAAMTAQGTLNFNYSQELKTVLAAAATAEEIAAITW